jgi:type III secretory pathway component EscS
MTEKTKRMKDWEAALLVIFASLARLWLFSIIGLLVGLVASFVYVIHNRN